MKGRYLQNLVFGRLPDMARRLNALEFRYFGDEYLLTTLIWRESFAVRLFHPPGKRSQKINNQIIRLWNGRSERIRTSDPLLPKQVRYQAALHSVL